MVPYSLKDLVQRTEVNKLVTDLVNLDRVRSLLKTISHRRRFLAHMQQVRAAKMEHGRKQSSHIYVVRMFTFLKIFLRLWWT